MRVDDATKRHAQYGAKHGASHEGADEGRTHLLGKDGKHHSYADAGIGCLADADQRPGEKHVLVILCKAGAQCSQAPNRGHQHQAADPAPAVGH
ncbi:hypothetical protein D9M73_189640 [compost metagenome]